MEMEGGEVNKFFKVWLIVFASLCYCYIISKNLPKGITRLITILPIVCLFIALPFNLTTLHLGGTTGFFIAWLSNFKLLLFAFGKGPLSSDPSISIGRFLALGCLPIKIQQHPSQKINPKLQNNGNPSPRNQIKEHPSPKTTEKGLKSPLNYAIKLLLLVMLVRVYDYSEYMHPTVIFILYCFHIYFLLEIILAMVAATARALLGLELEPQFNEPYLSSSLQDFWGRRWNIMVTSILRPTVYEPVLYFCTKLVGRKWAPLPAVLSTFLASALMHELMFYYLGRMKPTWEITLFFLLHGVCLMVEIALKKEFKGRWQLPRLMSGSLTIGFVMVTGFWLFIPQLLRCRGYERAVEESAALVTFLKDVGKTLMLNP